MKKFFASILIIFAVVFNMTGCGKAKALATVRQADELSAKLLIYGRNIAKANNDSFQAGNIPASVHLATNKAADVYLKGVDVFLEAIKTAKKAIEAGEKPDGQIDILQAVFNQQVVAAATALANMVVTLPAGLADKIGGWVAAIDLAIISFRGLFASVRLELKEAANA